MACTTHVYVRRQPPQLGALGLGPTCVNRFAACTSRRLAHDVVPLDVPRADGYVLESRREPAFQQPRIQRSAPRDRRKLSSLRGELAPGNQLPERDLATQNPLADDS